jgi:hypothetical protein
MASILPVKTVYLNGIQNGFATGEKMYSKITNDHKDQLQQNGKAKDKPRRTSSSVNRYFTRKGKQIEKHFHILIELTLLSNCFSIMIMCTLFSAGLMVIFGSSTATTNAIVPFP